MATFWPSTKPITFRPSRNAATRWAHGAAEPAAHQPADRHRGLLRPRRNRPRGRGATEQRDELAPPPVEHEVSPLGTALRLVSCQRSKAIEALSATLGCSGSHEQSGGTHVTGQQTPTA